MENLEEVNKKIDELSTQIFFFLDDEKLKTVQTNKKLTEFISYQDYKKISRGLKSKPTIKIFIPL